MECDKSAASGQFNYQLEWNETNLNTSYWGEAIPQSNDSTDSTIHWRFAYNANQTCGCSNAGGWNCTHG